MRANNRPPRDISEVETLPRKENTVDRPRYGIEINRDTKARAQEALHPGAFTNILSVLATEYRISINDLSRNVEIFRFDGQMSYMGPHYVLDPTGTYIVFRPCRSENCEVWAVSNQNGCLYSLDGVIDPRRVVFSDCGSKLVAENGGLLTIHNTLSGEMICNVDEPADRYERTAIRFSEVADALFVGYVVRDGSSRIVRYDASSGLTNATVNTTRCRVNCILSNVIPGKLIGCGIAATEGAAFCDSTAFTVWDAHTLEMEAYKQTKGQFLDCITGPSGSILGRFRHENAMLWKLDCSDSPNFKLKKYTQQLSPGYITETASYAYNQTQNIVVANYFAKRTREYYYYRRYYEREDEEARDGWLLMVIDADTMKSFVSKEVADKVTLHCCADTIIL
jgi:hypothetical protein